MHATLTLPFGLDPGDEIYLVFNVTRGKPAGIEGHEKLGLEVLPEPSAGKLRGVKLPRNVLCLRCTRKLQKGATLPVLQRVESVELTKVIHFGAGGLEVHTVDEEGLLPPQPTHQARKDEELDAFLRGEILDPEAYLQEVGGLMQDVAAFRAYFWDLDRETHVDLTRLVVLDAQTRVDAINLAMRILRERLVERARRRKDGRPLFPMAASVRPDDVPYLKYLSDLQLRILRKHFELDSPAGIARFERAYEMFSNGELGLYLPRSGAWACEPSSGYFFLFAEFGLLAVDPATPLAAALGPDRMVWTRLCNALVRTQEIFVRVYAPRSPSPQDSFEHFAATNYWYLRKPLNPREKEQLETKYAGRSVGELCTRTADCVLRHLPGVLL